MITLGLGPTPGGAQWPSLAGLRPLWPKPGHSGHLQPPKLTSQHAAAILESEALHCSRVPYDRVGQILPNYKMQCSAAGLWAQSCICPKQMLIPRWREVMRVSRGHHGSCTADLVGERAPSILSAIRRWRGFVCTGAHCILLPRNISLSRETCLLAAAQGTPKTYLQTCPLGAEPSVPFLRAEHQHPLSCP